LDLIKRKKINETTGDRIFGICCVAVVALLVFVILYPMWYILISSVSEPDMVLRGHVWWLPQGLQFDGYKRIFGDAGFNTGYKNTIFYTTASTVLSLIITLPCAYAVSKSRLPGRAAIMAVMMIPMYFNGGLIPTFLVMRNLGLYDNRLIMIIRGCISFGNTVIAMSFFRAMPPELEEAAYVDGCSTNRMFLTIVLPMSKAIISVLLLYYAVGTWNDYMTALIYIRSEDKQPLQIFLRRILIMNERLYSIDTGDEAYQLDAERLRNLLKYALIVISSLPVLALYPFIQKYFDKGVMLGSLKG